MNDMQIALNSHYIFIYVKQFLMKYGGFCVPPQICMVTIKEAITNEGPVLCDLSNSSEF